MLRNWKKRRAFP